MAKNTGNFSEKAVAAQNEIWANLRQCLDVVYRREPLDSPSYMKYYHSVYAFCTSDSTTEKRIATSQIPIGTRAKNHKKRNYVDDVGYQLYRRLRNYIDRHVKAVAAKMGDRCGEDILQNYTTQWDDFRASTKITNSLFVYLNRKWIKRTIGDGAQDVYTVYDLGIATWKHHMFFAMKDKVVNTVLELIHGERTGVIVNRVYMAETIRCIVELGDGPAIAEREGEAPEQNRLRIYKQLFEKKFIKATSEYYTQESVKLISAGTLLVDYIRKVEKWLSEEQYRVQLYLKPFTEPPVISACLEVLVAEHLDFFQNEFENLLLYGEVDILYRLYKLCRNIPDTAEKLSQSFERRIMKEAHGALERVALEAPNNAKTYVTTLIEVYEKYNNIVSKVFGSEPVFANILESATHVFVNTNAVTKKGPPQAQNGKSAELFARYCDQLLKKGYKMPGECELEELLSKIIAVFKYLADKDVFRKFYTTFFCKRITNQLSASDDAELNFVSLLQNVCGYTYTHRLCSMLSDVELSKNLLNGFKKKTNAKSGANPLEFTVLVLRPDGAWPVFPMAQLNLPAQISPTVETFVKYYKELHKGRHLKWVHSQCRGELSSNAFARKYVFSVTSVQMCTLLLFNENDSFTVEQTCRAIGMEDKICEMAVSSLVKNQVLKADTNVSGDESAATFSLNATYTNKKFRVDLTKMGGKTDQVREAEKVQLDVGEDRRSVISACIVRIMKMRKHLQHSQLISEVISQLSGYFKPTVEMIKLCIGSLIENEYMRRRENEKDVYEYVV